MEKSLFAQAGEIKGKEKEGFLSQTFQYTPSDEGQKKLRGSLFAHLEIKTEPREKAEKDSKLIFESFKSRFYASTGNNLRVLEGVLDSFEGFLKKEGSHASIVVAVLWGSVLYVGKVGDGGVLLSRNGKIKKIDFSKVASGALQDKDNVFLADESFLKNIQIEDLAKTSTKDDFEESVRMASEITKEKTGTALSVRLSIQEPIEKLENVMIADLDKDEVNKEDENLKKILKRRERIERIKKLFAKINFEKAKPILERGKKAAEKYFRKIAAYLAEPWKKREPGSHEDQGKRKRMRIIQIASVLAAILIVSVSVGIINHQIGQSKKALEEGISLVENNFSEAEKLKDINPAQAASLILEAEEKLGELSENDQKVKELKEKLAALLEKINRIVRMEAKEFADLSLLKGGIQAKYLKLAAGSIFVLDGGTGSVYRVNVSNGEPGIFISEMEGLQNIGGNNDLIFLQANNKISSVDTSTKLEKTASSGSSQWKEIIDAAAYRSNLYLLDSKAKQIWKYVPAASGLAGPQTYLKEQLNVDPVSFSVDGAVYLANKEEVYKFFNGNKQPFEIKDIPREISEIVDIYTRENYANLYILDRNNGIFVINKETGNYKGLYTSDKLAEATSFVVSEKAKTAYFLIGNSIYSIDIK